MKKFSVFLISLLFLSNLAQSQNPQIVKNVAGTVEFPFDSPNFLWRVNEWNGLVFYQGTGTPTKLCVTDGTNTGTKYIQDLGTSNASISDFFPAQDFIYIIVQKLVYTTSGSQINTEIWKSDGTTTGTSLVYTMPVSYSFSFVSVFYSNSITHKNYAISGNTLYFAGADQATTGVELWRTDGTTAGTFMVKDIKAGTGASYPAGFCKIGSDVFFSAAATGLNRKLFKTDGTAAGTVQVAVPEPFIVQNVDVGFVNNKMILYGTTDYTDNEPYVSDGTATGTFRLVDINPGGAGSNPSYLPAMQFSNSSKYCFFIAKNASNHNLWRTDGTISGTIKLTPDALNTQTYATGNAYDVNDSLLYFTTTQNQLYSSNGFLAGTRLVSSSLYAPDFTKIYQNAAWFRSSSLVGNPNVEAWRSDGTAANTNQAIDIYPGAYLAYPYSGGPRDFFVLNNKLYFFGYNIAVRNLYCYTGDFTFNGSQPSGLWSDSSNWNSRMPPGITDTVHINAGTPNALQIQGANASAGVLQIADGASIYINGTNILSINNSLTAGNNVSITGNGNLAMQNVGGNTTELNVGNNFSATNITVASPTNLVNGNVNVSGLLNLQNGLLSINNNFINLTGNTSSATGNNSSYILTNASGRLQIQNMGTGGRTGANIFPIGTATGYHPVSLQNNGTIDNFSAGVIPNIYGDYAGENPGTTQYQSGAVANTWFISEATPGGSNADINLQWNQQDELPAFDRSQAFISHYSSGNWDVVTSGTVSGTDPYSITRTGLTSFSPFSVKNQFAVLPVNFISIEGRNIQVAQNLITWKVAETAETKTYEIQRSDNGLSFYKIGTVTSSSNSSGQYLFYDNNVLKPIYYYRIIANSFSAVRQISSVVKIEARLLKGQLSVSPNPARAQTTIQLPVEIQGKHIALQIIDEQGKVIMKQDIEKSLTKIPLDISHLQKGVYFIYIIFENARYQTNLMVL